MIRRYIHWRNRNTSDRELRRVIDRANVCDAVLEDGRAGGGVVASLTRVKKPDHVHDRGPARSAVARRAKQPPQRPANAGLPLSLADTGSHAGAVSAYTRGHECRCRPTLRERPAPRHERDGGWRAPAVGEDFPAVRASRVSVGRLGLVRAAVGKMACPVGRLRRL